MVQFFNDRSKIKNSNEEFQNQISNSEFQNKSSNNEIMIIWPDLTRIEFKSFGIVLVLILEHVTYEKTMK